MSRARMTKWGPIVYSALIPASSPGRVDIYTMSLSAGYDPDERADYAFPDVVLGNVDAPSRWAFGSLHIGPHGMTDEHEPEADEDVDGNAIKWLMRVERALIASDVGFGKTLGVPR